MPRVTFVKSARKPDPKAGIQKGDSYYWWAFMSGGRGGPKIKSKTKPRRSQLTQSSFKSSLYEIQDNASENTPGIDELSDERDSIASSLEDLKSEMEGNLENMPEGLKGGDSGQTLQTRIDSLDECINTLQSICAGKEDKEDDQTEDEFRDSAWQEVIEALDNIDEG